MITVAGPTLPFPRWSEISDEEVTAEEGPLEAIVPFKWPIRLLEGDSQSLEGTLQCSDTLCESGQATRCIFSTSKDGVKLGQLLIGIDEVGIREGYFFRSS